MRNIGRILGALFLTLLAISCTENLELENDRLIQAVKNGELFKNQANATINDDGSIVFQANSPSEAFQMYLESSTPGTFELSGESESFVVYENRLTGERFTTRNFFGLGEVVIEEGGEEVNYNGYFDFVAYNETNTDSLYMREGLIYEVPARLGSENIDPDQEFINATVDGTDFMSGNVITQPGAGRIIAAGTSGNRTLTISFPAGVTPGTYMVDPTGDYNIIYSEGTSTRAAESGSLTISSVDTSTSRVTGSFEAVLESSGVMITNGSFEIAF